MSTPNNDSRAVSEATQHDWDTVMCIKCYCPKDAYDEFPTCESYQDRDLSPLPSPGAPTPRTDAARIEVANHGGMVFADFARTLERELTASRTQYDRLRAAVNGHIPRELEYHAAVEAERDRALADLALAREDVRKATVENALTAQDRQMLTFLHDKCRIIYFPGGDAYPIEHSMAARKDQWMNLLDAANPAERSEPRIAGSDEPLRDCSHPDII